MNTVFVNKSCTVGLRPPSQHTSSSSSPVNFTLCSFGVLISPPEKVIIYGHAITITYSNDVNSKLQLLKQKPSRLGRPLGSKDFSLVKTMPSFKLAPSSEMTCSSSSQFCTFIFLRETRLNSMERVNKYLKLPQLQVSRKQSQLKFKIS
ncbi:hypothetical protein SLE2022_260700 [Rubroshorea leprosula]